METGTSNGVRLPYVLSRDSYRCRTELTNYSLQRLVVCNSSRFSLLLIVDATKGDQNYK